MKKLSSFICAAILCASAIPALAASSEDNQQHSGKRHMPPPEAIEACKGLSEKDTCQFNGRNNELMSGVCDTPRHAAENSNESPTLVCRPKRGNHDKTPPEDKSSTQ